MSRQFQLYLLPEDIESLLRTLGSRLEIALIQPWSERAQAVPLQSTILRGGLLLGKSATRVDCYITPLKGADIRMYFLARRALWDIDIASEVIEFSGCEFDGSVLLPGRLYYQNDVPVEDMIVPKREPFLRWAEGVFRLAKKSLRRSKTLDAYVGEAAKNWARRGGRFASGVGANRKLIYVEPHSSAR